jgi:hypothetical protein
VRVEGGERATPGPPSASMTAIWGRGGVGPRFFFPSIYVPHCGGVRLGYLIGDLYRGEEGGEASKFFFGDLHSGHGGIRLRDVIFDMWGWLSRVGGRGG